MSSIESRIEYICSKLDNLSAEIKDNNVNLFEFMKKTETSLKLKEQKLEGIKIDIESYTNKLDRLEKSQTFISSQFETQSKRNDNILTDHAKLQANLIKLNNNKTEERTKNGKN